MSKPDYYEYDRERGTITPRNYLSTYIIAAIVLVLVFAVGISILSQGDESYLSDNGDQNYSDSANNNKPQTSQDSEVTATLDDYVGDGTYERRGPVSDAFGKTYNCNYWDIPIAENDSYPDTVLKAYSYDWDFKYLSGAFFPNPDNGSDVTFEVFIYGTESEAAYGVELELIYSSGIITQNSRAKDYTINIEGYHQIHFEVLCHSDVEYDNNPRIIFTDGKLSH